jgi:hypothetical protein
MRAVGERITPAPRRRIVDLRQARRAGRRVGRDRSGDRTAAAADDAEPSEVPPSARRRFNFIDARQRRRISNHAAAKFRDGVFRPFDADQHPLGIVRHLAREPERRGNPPGRGPEAHALHGAADANLDRGARYNPAWVTNLVTR